MRSPPQIENSARNSPSTDREDGSCARIFRNPQFRPRSLGRRDVTPWARVSECEYLGPSPFERHEHHIAYIGLVVRGGYRESYMREDRTARAGSVISYAQGECHEGTIPVSGAQLFHLELDPQRARANGAGRGACMLETIDGLALSPLVGLMIRLRLESRADDDCSRLARVSLVAELLDRLGRQVEVRASSSSWLGRVRDQIHDRSRELLSLQDLADDVEVHPSHMARTFSDQFGCSVGAYQRRLRVADAARTIGQGAALAEAAFRAGFADQAHLTRVFRAETGLTPGAYRRDIRG